MTEGVNPWLSQPVQAATTTIAAPDEGLASRTTGPLAPQRGVPPPDHVDQLPTYARPRGAELWWLGTHGGSAESSLAALVPEWRAADHGWPDPPGNDPVAVVLTARSNLRGLRSAQVAATQWAAGLVPRVHVVGLVVVADAPGRLPPVLRDFAKVVGGGVPRAWHLPWIEEWRLAERPDPASAPREVRRLVDDLRGVIRSGAAGTALRKEYR